ncbi:hypothetical protein BJX99DRAFT_258195 [Aspergillus californicus]
MLLAVNIWPRHTYIAIEISNREYGFRTAHKTPPPACVHCATAKENDELDCNQKLYEIVEWLQKSRYHTHVMPGMNILPLIVAHVNKHESNHEFPGETRSKPLRNFRYCSLILAVGAALAVEFSCPTICPIYSVQNPPRPAPWNFFFFTSCSQKLTVSDAHPARWLDPVATRHFACVAEHSNLHLLLSERRKRPEPSQWMMRLDRRADEHVLRSKPNEPIRRTTKRRPERRRVMENGLCKNLQTSTDDDGDEIHVTADDDGGDTAQITPCDGTDNSTEWCCGLNATDCCGTSDAITIAPVLAALATPTPSSSSTATSSTASPTTYPEPDTQFSSSSSNGLSTGAKAGIGAGVGAGGIAIIGALLYFWLRRRKAKPAYVPAGVPGPESSPQSDKFGGYYGQAPYIAEVDSANMHELNAGAVRHELTADPVAGSRL